MVDQPVTSFQASAVVTENGIADLWGRSYAEQARLLVAKAAHPAVRDDLRSEAEALGLLP
jgi:acyl-CoA hydrolase